MFTTLLFHLKGFAALVAFWFGAFLSFMPGKTIQAKKRSLVVVVMLLGSIGITYTFQMPSSMAAPSDIVAYSAGYMLGKEPTGYISVYDNVLHEQYRPCIVRVAHSHTTIAPLAKSTRNCPGANTVEKASISPIAGVYYPEEAKGDITHNNDDNDVPESTNSDNTDNEGTDNDDHVDGDTDDNDDHVDGDTDKSNNGNHYGNDKPDNNPNDDKNKHDGEQTYEDHHDNNGNDKVKEKKND